MVVKVTEILKKANTLKQSFLSWLTLFQYGNQAKNGRSRCLFYRVETICFEAPDRPQIDQVLTPGKYKFLAAMKTSSAFKWFQAH